MRVALKEAVKEADAAWYGIRCVKQNALRWTHSIRKQLTARFTACPTFYAWFNVVQTNLTIKHNDLW